MTISGSTSPARDYLIDVSRLIWRAWRGRPATGIDRVCLAYLNQFGSRAQAVIQRRGSTVVLSPGQSVRLFRLLSAGLGASKTNLVRRLAAGLLTARPSPPRRGMIYLNVGHTGLDSPALPRWISRNGVRAVYLIHDLIPLTHPQFCRPGEDLKHERRMAHALTSAAGIIGNSEETLKELGRFAASKALDHPPATVAWISGYTAGNRLHSPAIRGPYFVTVGTIEARKNHLILLRAWGHLVKELGNDSPTLVIIGSRGWEADEAINQLDDLGPLRSHVLEISSCDDEQLAAWIAGARALLMPSFVEGFGLPVIEAFDVGTPVIAADLPVYREVVGEIPTYLDPNDTDAWVTTIRAFTTESPERHRQLSHIAQYRAPTWEDHFRTVEPWLAELPSR